MSDGAFFGCFLLALAALMLVGACIGYVASNISCHARWPDRTVDFGLFSGCLVESPNGGGMVPEDRVWFEKGRP